MKSNFAKSMLSSTNVIRPSEIRTCLSAVRWRRSSRSLTRATTSSTGRIWMGCQASTLMARLPIHLPRSLSPKGLWKTSKSSSWKGLMMQGLKKSRRSNASVQWRSIEPHFPMPQPCLWGILPDHLINLQSHIRLSQINTSQEMLPLMKLKD